MRSLHAALLPTLLTVASAQAPGISWLTDLDAARAVAKERSAPLFVTFRCES